MMRILEKQLQSLLRTNKLFCTMGPRKT